MLTYCEGQRPGVCARCGWSLAPMHSGPLRLCPLSSQPGSIMPPTTPETIPAPIIELAATAAAAPPGHHSISIFERVWAFFTGTVVPVAGALIAANNPALAPEIALVVTGVQTSGAAAE